jgi:hypothetical protein
VARQAQLEVAADCVANVAGLCVVALTNPSFGVELWLCGSRDAPSTCGQALCEYYVLGLVDVARCAWPAFASDARALLPGVR